MSQIDENPYQTPTQGSTLPKRKPKPGDLPRSEVVMVFAGIAVWIIYKLILALFF